MQTAHNSIIAISALEKRELCLLRALPRRNDGGEKFSRAAETFTKQFYGRYGWSNFHCRSVALHICGAKHFFVFRPPPPPRDGKVFLRIFFNDPAAAMTAPSRV